MLVAEQETIYLMNKKQIVVRGQILLQLQSCLKGYHNYNAMFLNQTTSLLRKAGCLWDSNDFLSYQLWVIMSFLSVIKDLDTHDSQ